MDFWSFYIFIFLKVWLIFIVFMSNKCLKCLIRLLYYKKVGCVIGIICYLLRFMVYVRRVLGGFEVM